MKKNLPIFNERVRTLCATTLTLLLMFFTVPTVYGQAPQRLYWVGGSGNWDDVNHWSNVSGGKSSGATPTRDITVVFDDNSGLDYAIVNINVQAHCDSMLWKMASSTATLSVSYFLYAAPSVLNIGGSLLLPPGLQLCNVSVYQSGTITFTSARPSETIITNGVVFERLSVTFDGTGGWKLTDLLNIRTYSDDLYHFNFTSGNLDLSNTTLNIAGNFSSATGNSTRTLNIAGATIEANSWTYSGGAPLLPVHSAGSLIRLTNGGFTGKNGDAYNVLEGPIGTVAFGNFNKIIVNKGIVTFNNAANAVINTDTLLFVSGSVCAKIRENSSVNVEKYLAKTHSNQLALASSSATVPATINMGASSTVKMDTLLLRQITINGPGPVAGNYPTEGSVDQGGNTHWIFNNPYIYPEENLTYYWRGGLRNGVFTEMANYELDFPGSNRSPTTIFGANNDVVFPPNVDNPASMTLTCPGTASFKNLHFDAGSAVTLNLGNNIITGTENLIIYEGNRLNITASNNSYSCKLNKNIFLKENSRLDLSSTPIVAEDSIIVEENAVISGGTMTAAYLIVKGKLQGGNISVTEDFVVYPHAEVNGTEKNVTAKNLQLDGTLQLLLTIGTSKKYSFDNLNISATGYCSIRNTFSEYGDGATTPINLGNTLIAPGGALKISCAYGGWRTSFTSSGQFISAGTVILDGIPSMYFKGDFINTGDAAIVACTTYIQSANSYTLSLNTPVNTVFKGGSFRFDATAPFTMIEDLIMPSTDFYITATNRGLTSNGYHIKSNLFDMASNNYMHNFSGSLLEAIGFTINRTTAGMHNFTTTTLSFLSTLNHNFNVNLNGGTIGKVTYTESAPKMTITTAGNGVRIDTLITGDSDIFLNYSAANYITANVWTIDKPCKILGNNNPVINVGKMNIPPPASCGGISMLQSLNGRIQLNNTSTNPIDLRYLYCLNVNFLGSATPKAFFSRSNYDLGGNTGSIDWTGTPDSDPPGQDFYWIGENGDWHNENNWSFDQYPPKTPASCVPTMFDNAIFDEYSFANNTQNVTVNSVATINNILWIDPNNEGGIILNADLEVFGSSDFTGCRYATGTTTARITYSGSGTITSGGLIYNIQIFIFSATGTYTLMDDLILSQGQTNSLDRGIFHYSGGLVSNGHNITASLFNSSATSAAQLDLAGSTITLVTDNGSTPLINNNWILTLSNLTSSNFINSKILAYNATTNGSSGNSVQYHDMEFRHALVHNRNDLNVSYNILTAKGVGIYPRDYERGEFTNGFTADTVILTAYQPYYFWGFHTGNPLTANAFITTATPWMCNSDVSRIEIIGVNPLKINVLNTPFELVRVIASNVNCIGEPLYITDGGDNGNNTNVYFLQSAPIPAMDFYWVPNTQVNATNTGSGNWSDGSHWSIGVSGGDPSITNPRGCIPSQFDSVIFDHNSFTASLQTVTSGVVCYCKSMVWTSEAGSWSPTFTVGNIYIYGSLELTSGLRDFAFGSLYMMGASLDSGVHYIQSNGFALSPSLYRTEKFTFTGGGRYDLFLSAYPGFITVNNGSSLHIQQNIYLSNGNQSSFTVDANSSLYAHGNSIRTTNFTVSAGTLPRTIDLTGSIINIGKMDLTLDNFTTMDISYTNITTNGTITLAEYCNWNAANSNIISAGPLTINNTTPVNFAFHNIKMTGTTLANAKLGGSGNGPLSFNKVEFTGINTQITGTATYTIDSLIYAKSSYNEIAAGKTLNINKYLFANGSPCVNIEIVSTSTSPAYINSTACTPFHVHLGEIRYVEAVTSGGCHAYTIYGNPNFQKGATGWEIDPFILSEVTNMLGNDTTITCKDIPFLQTSEKYGVGDTYTWYYKPNTTAAWGVLPNKESSLLIEKPGYYSLFVTYGVSCSMGGPTVEEKIVTFNIVIPPATISTTPPATTQLSDINPTITLTANAVEDPTGTLYTYLWKNRNTGVVVSTSQTYVATDSGTYTVIVKTSENGCADSASVQILPRAPSELLSEHSIPDICSGEEIDYEIIGKYNDTKVSWSRAYVEGISPATGSGSANANTLRINETLTNSTNQPITVTYEIKLQLQGNTITDYVTVKVKPKKQVSATIKIKN